MTKPSYELRVRWQNGCIRIQPLESDEDPATAMASVLRHDDPTRDRVEIVEVGTERLILVAALDDIRIQPNSPART